MSRWLVGSSSSSRSGSRHQRLAEQRAPPPAARQLAHRPVRRQRQPRDDQSRPLLEPPAVPLLELVLQLAQPLERARRRVVRDAHRGVVVVRDERAELAEARRRPRRTRVRSPAPGRPGRAARRAAPARARSRRRRAATSPTTTLSRLDLPEPLRPMSAMRSPGSMRRSARSKSGRWPKASETLSRVRMGMPRVNRKRQV